MTLMLQQRRVGFQRRSTVPQYDYSTRRYVVDARGNTPQVDFMSGPAFEELLINTYGQNNSLTKRLYMQERGIHLADVYDALGIAPKDLNATKVRDILTDDQMKPWFGPTTEEGFRIGLKEIQDQWEPLIGTTVPVPSGAAEWYNLADPETSDAYTFKGIAQAAQIPVAIITVNKQGIVLDKKGRGVQWTYEAQRAPVSLAQLWLRILGMRLGRSYLGLLGVRAINGYMDDNSDDPVIIATATGHLFTLEDLLTARFTQAELYGMEPTDLLLSLDALIGLLIMQWPVSGTPVFPNGIESIKELLRIQEVRIIDSLDDEQIVFINRSAAFIRYVAEEFSTEDDRVPGMQLLATYGTMTDQITTGGMKGAVVVLNANHA